MGEAIKLKGEEERDVVVYLFVGGVWGPSGCRCGPVSGAVSHSWGHCQECQLDECW